MRPGNPAVIRMIRDERDASDPERILATVGGSRSRSTYQTDQIVYSQGDRADSVFYLQSGRIKANVISAKGKEAVVAILSPGSFCGEECLAGYELRTTTVTALTESVVIRMPKANVMRALRDDAAFSGLFTAYLMERGIRAQEDLADLLLNSTEKRLARLLLVLANEGDEGRLDPTVPRINQETLAEMIGTSRTHVNFFMNKFRQLGFIEYSSDLKGGIKVNRSLSKMLLQDAPGIKKNR
jgi:CRP-like cAMP-binding protein